MFLLVWITYLRLVNIVKYFSELYCLKVLPTTFKLRLFYKKELWNSAWISTVQHELLFLFSVKKLNVSNIRDVNARLLFPEPKLVLVRPLEKHAQNRPDRNRRTAPDASK